MAAVTNHHGVGGLKQHRLNLLQFWNSEVRNGWKPRYQQGHDSSRGSRGESIPLPFPASSAAFFWLMALSSPPQGRQHSISESLCLSSHGLLFCVVKSPLAPSYRRLVSAFSTHPDISGHCPRLKVLNLITSAMSALPYKVVFTGSRNWDLGHFGSH